MKPLPQLTYGMPIDMAADVPLFPPFATALTVFVAFVCSRIVRLKLATWISLSFRVVALAIAIGMSIWVVRTAGDELDSAGSGTLFTPVGGLATGGLYQYTRNPMYSGLVFVCLPAAAVFFNSLWPLLLGPLLFYYLNNVVIAAEEKLLYAAFGAQYEALCKVVPRWLVHLRL
jgi:protein-S-isoprenylcysteine O-methyltransferase Ste14|mmetsp:Transcript_32061/g.94421  ORF Transcript_32061/g.94421 Transcript_32061/m.94421 type:complete len:173 (-) Transcript_32061:265-783(-)